MVRWLKFDPFSFSGVSVKITLTTFGKILPTEIVAFHCRTLSGLSRAFIGPECWSPNSVKVVHVTSLHRNDRREFETRTMQGGFSMLSTTREQWRRCSPEQAKQHDLGRPKA